MKSTFSFILFFSIISTKLLSAPVSIKVIYGEDNRVDPLDSKNSMYQVLAKSTAAMVATHKIEEINSLQVLLGGVTLQNSAQVCADEVFAMQPAIARCSGFLVGSTTLVTAGHCVTSENDCSNNSWVFDFAADHPTKGEVIVDKEAVYKCKKIVTQVLDGASKMDYAVIELTRAVTDRRPLKFRTSGQIEVGAPLVVIGHPSGLPTKIADGANVRSVNNVYFKANLDTYGGNSGSAVFNSETGIVEGILVRGETDYVYNANKGCRESNVVAASSGDGEEVTLITNVPGLKVVEEIIIEPVAVTTPGSELEVSDQEDSQNSRAQSWLERFLRLIFG